MYKRADGLYEKKIIINGKREVFRAKTEPEVWQKVAAFKEKKKKGEYFKDVAAEWKKTHFPTLASNTLKGYSPALERAVEYFKNKRVTEITGRDCKSYVAKLSSKYCVKTVSNYLLVLRLILDHADLDTNPALGVKAKGLPRKKRDYPNDADQQIIYESENEPFGIIFSLALQTGARREEIFALTWGDVDFENGLINIDKALYWTTDNIGHLKNTKTKDGTRKTILPQKIKKALLAYKASNAKDKDIIFPNPDDKNEYMRNYQIEVGVRQFRKTTGLSLGLHAMRHGFATNCFEAGMDIPTVQHLMGHAQASTTLDVYTHWQAEKRLSQAAQLMDKKQDGWHSFGTVNQDDCPKTLL